jgi:hypothetical protein
VISDKLFLSRATILTNIANFAALVSILAQLARALQKQGVLKPV